MYPAQKNGFRTGFGIQKMPWAGQPKPVNNTISQRFYPLKSLSRKRFFGKNQKDVSGGGNSGSLAFIGLFRKAALNSAKWK